jgi:hypothetical protein
LGAHLLGSDEVAFPVGPASLEALRIGVNRDYLEELAAKSGGELVEGDPSALFALLKGRGEAQLEVVGRAVSEPWANPWILLLALALFGLDWLLRRLFE